MFTLNTIFVVIDPTTDVQAALVSATRIASQNKEISVHVYEAVYSSGTNTDADALQRVELARHHAWVKSLTEPLEAAGNAVNIEIEWTADWRDAIAPAAKRAGADLIVKAASARSGAGRRMLKTSDWTLLRNSHCPVYLIKKDELQSGIKVLVALDIARDDELHTQLNDRVLEFGHALVDNIPENSLHAVNAYSTADNFVSPPDLAEKAGIERTDAYTVDGAPEKVIPEIAEQIGADIVILGTAARAGIQGIVIGNTAEKILDALNTNILTVNAE
ncbi:MAG: hypothetical protein COA96_12150 [SAR86 cluster bacterium]|uniref:UspA domain-containing protein n=1 Tax=SAR86 cluster bacterium TaxID=2030880 RepID=A0A2A5AVN7_9GAMM|nr:MAG: hypothetical protein COA96_12150 [SAR86 cluster bacterium]